MSLLQVFLPNNWPSPESNSATPFRWRLTDGVTTRMGESPLDSLPRGAEVELILPASRVFLTRIKLPPGNTQKLSEIVSYAVEDKLLGDPETIHAAVGLRGADGAATAAIVDRAWLIAVRDLFSAADLRPIRGVSEIATAPYSQGAWNLVWHGDQGWLRTNEDQGSVIDSAGANAPLALLLAIQEAHAANALPREILVHAADGQELPDLTRWENELQIPVIASAEWSWKRIEAPTRRGVNLLQGAFAPSRSPSELLARFRMPAMLAAGIAGLYLAVSFADYAWLTWQKHALLSEMKTTFKTTFPDAQVIVNAPLQMQRKVAELKRAHGEAQETDLVPLLATALPAIAATGGKPQALQYDHGKLSIDLKLPQAHSAQSLSQIVSGAGGKGRVESVNPTPGGVLARIVFTGAPS